MEGGGGARKRSRGPSPAAPRHHPANNIIAQLQQFKCIEMLCNVAGLTHSDHSHPLSTRPPLPRWSRHVSPSLRSLRKDTAEPLFHPFSAFFFFLSALPNLILGSADVTA